MREIKFRAWATAEKKMFLPVYFDNLEVHWWSEEDGQLVIIGDVKENSMLHQAIIMQFTGLKDKNGKEIYEGDIAQVGLFALNDTQKFGEKPWNNLPAGVKKDDITTVKSIFAVEWSFLQLHNLHVLITDNPDVVGVEVIGNIYETPELI
jgi:uncharacterized phage protein (TIGR01671 family)